MTRPLPGDILSRRKGFVMHRGIALGDGRVLHNTPFRGEHIATEAEFSAGKRVYVTRLDPMHRRTVLDRAREHGDGYHLFNNNCEHTVSRTVSGVPESPQLRGIVGGVLAGGLVLALTRHPGAAVATFAAARAWFG
jgi:hypothetical protein